MQSTLRNGTPSDPVKYAEVRRRLAEASSLNHRHASRGSYARVTGGGSRPPQSTLPSSISPEWKFEVGEKDINVDSRNRTVIMRLRGKNSAATKIDDILAALTANGIDADDVSAIYKAEDQREVHLTFGAKKNTDECLKCCSINISEQVKGDVLPVKSNFHEIRVHWVPDFLNDNLLRSAFGRIGKIQSIEKARDIRGRYGSIRLIKIEADWREISKVPHLMELSYEGKPHRLLITMKGRPPLCLICSELGHTRRFCPDSPAMKAQRLADQLLREKAERAADLDSDSENEETTEKNAEHQDQDTATSADVTASNMAATANPTDAVHTPSTATAAESQPDTPDVAATRSDVAHPPAAFADPLIDSLIDRERGDSKPDPIGASLGPSTIESLTQPPDPDPSLPQTNDQDSSPTQKSALWADEMDDQDRDEEEENMDSEIENDLDLEVDSPSDTDIPCAQPEKHRAPKRKNGSDFDPPRKSNRVGKGRAKPLAT